MPMELTASRFIARMLEHQSDEELQKIQRYFKTDEGEYGAGDRFMGIRMGKVFEIAQDFIDLDLVEVEVLLESDIHEVRAGACSVMDKKGRKNKQPEIRRQDLYNLYLRRHDRINNWDLVDLAAMHVVGRWLVDKPRDILYTLAKSSNIWERRTAIVSTGYFIKREELYDTYALAELLLNDPEDLIHKAVGGFVRYAGSHDRTRHLNFLDQHAAAMPRVMLRYAIEHLDPEQRKHYLSLKGSERSIP
jgi:3-methyladenine DNA glycosylase AlkD